MSVIFNSKHLYKKAMAKNKKGVSPVIATVLLLTLTVLLGFIIFESSTNFIRELSPPQDCPEVVFEAGLYLENNQLRLEVNNLGNKDIAGIEIGVDNKAGSIDTRREAIATPTGRASSKEITYFNIPQNAKLTARAQVIENSKLITCIDEEIIGYSSSSASESSVS